MTRAIKFRSVASSVLILALLVGLFSFSGAFSAGPGTGTRRSDSKDGILVLFDRAPGAAELNLVRNLGGQIRYNFHLIPGLAVANLSVEACSGLLRNPRVLACDADGEVFAINAELDNTWGVKRVGAGTVHSAGNLGAGVKIAVIDSGVDYTHPELSGVFVSGYDFVNDDADPMDDNGHGTHVAGTIVAARDGAGVVGASPSVSLYVLKVLSAGGSGNWSNVIAALQWAVDNGIQITNNSYGSGSDPGATVKAAFDNSAAAGVLHVAAAGNSGNCAGKGNNIGYPARYASVIAVAATNQNDSRPCFSSTGPDVELAAPGVSINSTLMGGGYGTMSGTSMASPHVAGTAALVIATGASDIAQVRQILASTANDIGPTGKDNLYGYGLVNAASAVAAVVINPPPPGDEPPPNEEPPPEENCPPGKKKQGKC